MLGLAEGVVEVHGGGEDDRVAHFVEGICDAVLGQRVEELFGGLGDGLSRVGKVDVEREGEMVAQVVFLEEEVADGVQIGLELGKVGGVGELIGEGQI